MKLSSTEEYGLRCLLRLSSCEYGMNMTIPQISQAEGITHHNVAKMLRILRRGGFVESVRGQNGGYVLARSAREISLSEVLAVLGDPLFDASFCEQYTGSTDNCSRSHINCSLRELWNRLQIAVDEVVGSLTLNDLQHGEFFVEGKRSSELLKIND